MSDENVTTEAPQENITKVYEGETPAEGLDAYLEVDAKATKKLDDGSSEFLGATLFYKFGANLAEAVELFGEEVVFTNFRAQAKIRLQALMRSWILKGQDLGKLSAEWKPGIQMERAPVDPIVAAEQQFMKMDQAAQEAFLARLIERQRG
jgi:hypothetical protein